MSTYIMPYTPAPSNIEQQLLKEIVALKAENARLKQQSEKMQTEMLELLKDLHKIDNMSRLIHDTKPTNHNG